MLRGALGKEESQEAAAGKKMRDGYPTRISWSQVPEGNILEVSKILPLYDRVQKPWPQDYSAAECAKAALEVSISCFQILIDVFSN